MKRSLIVLLLLLLIASPAFAANETYTINVILARTGASAFLGKSEEQALRVYESVVNKSGGIHGKRLKFKIADDQSNPLIDVQILNGLLTEHPVVILGPGATANAAAAMPLIRHGPVLFTFVPGIAPPPGSYVFASSATVRGIIEFIFVHLKQIGYKRVAVITATDANGLGDLKVTTDWFASPASRGMDLVASEQFNPADIGIAAQVARIRAANSDVIMIWASGPAFGTALRELANAGLNDLLVGTNPTNANPGQLTSYASFLPNVLFLSGMPYQGRLNATSPLRGAAEEYLNAMKDAGVQPNALQLYAWDPAKLVITALRALPQNTTAEQLHAYLANLHGFAGVMGIYDFRTGDHQHGLSGAAFPFIRWDPDRHDWVPFDVGRSK